MLSPKMQRSVRVNENQLIMLSDKAQYDHSMVSDESLGETTRRKRKSLSRLLLLLLVHGKSCKASKNRSFSATAYLQSGAQLELIHHIRQIESAWKRERESADDGGMYTKSQNTSLWLFPEMKLFDCKARQPKILHLGKLL